MEGRPPAPPSQASSSSQVPSTGSSNNRALEAPTTKAPPRPQQQIPGNYAGTAMANGGYTPEMIRQAQLQVQYLQQMRMAQQGGGQIPPGVRATGIRPFSPQHQMGGRPVGPVTASTGGGTFRAPSMTMSTNRPTSGMPSENTRTLATGPVQSPSLSDAGSTTPTATAVPLSATSPTASTAIALPIFSQFNTITPYNPKMDERAFLESLARFMYLVNCPLKKIPLIRPDRQLPMLRLFQLVTAFGGFARVCEGNRWTAIAVSLEMSPITPETVATLQKVYATILFTYEQVYFLKVPLDRVIWPQQLMSFFASPTGAVNSANITAALSQFTQKQQQQRQQQQLQKRSGAMEDQRSRAQPAFPSTASATVTAQSPSEASSETAVKTQLKESHEPLRPSLDIAAHPVASVTTSASAKRPVKKESEDPAVETVYKMTRKVKQISRATLGFGRVSLEEIALMLSSRHSFLESMGLIMLERISSDQQASLIDASTLGSFLDCLCNLFTKDMAAAVDNAKTLPKGQRPFDWLLRMEEATKTSDLLRIKRRPSVQESIVNILRNWSLVEKGNYSAVMAKHQPLLRGVLLPTLTECCHWQRINLEIYSNFWLILHQLIPHLTHSLDNITALLGIAHEDVAFCLDNQYRWTHILHERTIFDVNVESQRIISRFISLIPPPATADDDEAADAMELSFLNEWIGTLWKGFELLLPIIYGYIHGARVCLQALLGGDKSSYVTQLGRYLHNPNGSINDGGYLELLLQTILQMLRRYGAGCDGSFADSMLTVLLRLIDSIRHLYLRYPPMAHHPAPYLIGSPEGKRSILLSEPIVTHSTHPYRLLILAEELLSLLSTSARTAELRWEEIEMLVGWISTDDEMDPSHRELIRSQVLCRIVNSLL